MDKLLDRLTKEIAQIPIIDSHEHLISENEAIGKSADLFTRIYCHYSLTNALSAGMGVTRDYLRDTTVPLEERWKSFKPYLASIKYTGYAKAAQIAARDIYGIDEINDDTYALLSDRIQKENRPGLYKKILVDKCHIECILNQGSWYDGPIGYAREVSRDFLSLGEGSASTMFDLLEKSEKEGLTSFHSPGAWMESWCEKVSKRQCPGVKIYASLSPVVVENREAENLFTKLQLKDLTDKEALLLGEWMLHRLIEWAPRYSWTVAVHCGLIYDVYQDFRTMKPDNLIPLFLKYRDTKFDLYHGGIPWVRIMGVMGNQYPNVNLNLVWCHQISPHMTRSFLNEWIDLVPLSKITAFGGDNCDGPEKTYAALKMAVENITHVLAGRIQGGEMNEETALEIARLWLYDNPKEIYQLKTG